MAPGAAQAVAEGRVAALEPHQGRAHQRRVEEDDDDVLDEIEEHDQHPHAGRHALVAGHRLPVAGEDAGHDERGRDDDHGDRRDDGEDDELLVLQEYAPAQLDQLPAPSEAPHGHRPPRLLLSPAGTRPRPQSVRHEVYRPCRGASEARRASPTGAASRGVPARDRTTAEESRGRRRGDAARPGRTRGGSHGQGPGTPVRGPVRGPEDRGEGLRRPGHPAPAGAGGRVRRRRDRTRRGRHAADRAPQEDGPSHPHGLRGRRHPDRAHAVHRHPLRGHRRRHRRARASRRGQPAEERCRGTGRGAGRQRGGGRHRQQEDRARPPRADAPRGVAAPRQGARPGARRPREGARAGRRTRGERRGRAARSAARPLRLVRRPVRGSSTRPARAARPSSGW